MAYDASALQLHPADSAAEEELLEPNEQGHAEQNGEIRSPWSRRHIFLPVLLISAGACVATIYANPGSKLLSAHVDTSHGYLSTEELLASADLRDAITEVLSNANATSPLSALSQRPAMRSLVDARFQELGAQERDLSLRGAVRGKWGPHRFVTHAQKDALVATAHCLASGNLTLAGRGGDRGIYRFGSTDAGHLGTGSLGKLGEEEDSVSEVVLSTSSVPAQKIRFTVGPPIGSKGMFLIDGTMTVTQTSTERTYGSIKVGFVNLHSTLSGTWWADGDTSNLGNRTLHVRLSGMSPSEKFPDERWTWRPVETESEDVDESYDSYTDDHVTCSDSGENCSSTRCCNDMDLTCYSKDTEGNWSGCRSSCEYGQPAPGESQAQGVWWCQDLTSHRKNTQLLLKRGFVTGTRVRAYFEGTWYTGTVVLEPETGSCDKHRHPLACDRRLEWKIQCDGSGDGKSVIQYFFTNRMIALPE